MDKHVHTLLAIDDDVDDLSLLHDALRAIDRSSTLLTAPNGALGLQKLEQMKRDDQLPCIIVLDVNMPVMDGRKTYEAIRSDEVLSTIPLVVFSTSASPLDKIYFEHKGANYLIKPVQYEELLKTAQRFLEYCPRR